MMGREVRKIRAGQGQKRDRQITCQIFTIGNSLGLKGLITCQVHHTGFLYDRRKGYLQVSVGA